MLTSSWRGERKRTRGLSAPSFSGRSPMESEAPIVLGGLFPWRLGLTGGFPAPYIFVRFAGSCSICRRVCYAPCHKPIPGDVGTPRIVHATCDCVFHRASRHSDHSNRRRSVDRARAVARARWSPRRADPGGRQTSSQPGSSIHGPAVRLAAEDGMIQARRTSAYRFAPGAPVPAGLLRRCAVKSGRSGGCGPITASSASRAHISSP